MSEGRIGYKTKLAWGDGATPEVFTEIAEQISLEPADDADGRGRVLATRTRLNFRKEFKPSWIDGGELTRHLQLHPRATRRRRSSATIATPRPSATGGSTSATRSPGRIDETVTFAGWVKSFKLEHHLACGPLVEHPRHRHHPRDRPGDLGVTQPVPRRGPVHARREDVRPAPHHERPGRASRRCSGRAGDLPETLLKAGYRTVRGDLPRGAHRARPRRRAPAAREHDPRGGGRAARRPGRALQGLARGPRLLGAGGERGVRGPRGRGAPRARSPPGKVRGRGPPSRPCPSSPPRRRPDGWHIEPLFVQCVRAGMGAEDFWHATPAELGRYLEGATLARRDMIDALTMSAWQIVAFDRTKRLPDLRGSCSAGPPARKPGRRRPRGRRDPRAGRGEVARVLRRARLTA